MGPLPVRTHRAPRPEEEEKRRNPLTRTPLEVLGFHPARHERRSHPGIGDQATERTPNC